MLGRLLAVALVVATIGCAPLEVIRGEDRTTDKVEIEVDWTTPAPPPPAVIDMLRQVIARYCDPSVQVRIVLDDDVHHSARDKWTDTDLQMFALLHRSPLTGRFYMLWANGRYDDEGPVGGYSWGTRCFALWPASMPGEQLQALSAAHEFFHNVGLVDKGLEMQTPHKHAYGHHCNQQWCLMFPVSGPSMLCQYCVADLEAGEQ